MRKLLLMCLAIVISKGAFAADVVSESLGGGVNWTEGYVWADGYGVAPAGSEPRKTRLLARRAAEVDAYRNLAEFVKGVRVSSDTLVRELVVESDIIRTQVEGLIRGAQKVKDHYQNDIATVQMRIYFDGPLSEAINGPSLKHTQVSSNYKRLLPDWSLHGAGLDNIERTLGAFFFSSAYADEQPQLIRSSNDLEFAERLMEASESTDPDTLLKLLQVEAQQFVSTNKYTGLLIDATDVPDFQLAMIPRIRNRAGDVIYPSNDLFSSTLGAKRPVSYDFDIQDAIRNTRIAVTPLVVKAESTYKARHSDLVISDKDADFISARQNMLSIMQKAGVMIVVAE